MKNKGVKEESLFTEALLYVFLWTSLQSTVRIGKGRERLKRLEHLKIEDE